MKLPDCLGKLGRPRALLDGPVESLRATGNKFLSVFYGKQAVLAYPENVVEV